METKQKSIHSEILEGLKSYRCQHLRDGPDGDGLPLVDVFSACAPSIKPGIDELEMLADHIWDNITDDAIRLEVPTPPQPPVPEAGGQEALSQIEMWLTTIECHAVAMCDPNPDLEGLALALRGDVRDIRKWVARLARLPSPPPPAEQQPNAIRNAHQYLSDLVTHHQIDKDEATPYIEGLAEVLTAPADQGQAPQQGGGIIEMREELDATTRHLSELVKDYEIAVRIGRLSRTIRHLKGWH